jgi:hypothetical protein
VPGSYTDECKKEVVSDVEVPIGLECRIAIHINFEGVISLVQRDSIEKKISGLKSSKIPMQIP